MRNGREKVKVLWTAFIDDESGATAIEYALIGTLIAVAIIGGMNALAGSINTVFGNASTELTTSVTP